MMADSRLLLDEAWQQCQRHLHHLQHALTALQPVLPVSAEALPTFDDEVVQDWDQFILRFTKLQDAMGARLFPTALAYLQEPYDDRPMLDKLHRLEKLGYLSSVERWQELRVIRNRFAHDYPQDDVLRAGYLNQAATAAQELAALLERFRPLIEKA